ncbi:unnamed protein product [Brassicogethes aeneus]|uniref:Uncharacterized protein n=1 Tax=Brassicogethes aeneus TaxID=1431903 RepID=A0A9P0BG28_BRAAE|nr:unnamed protein product [Brassicogethes aeneus]
MERDHNELREMFMNLMDHFQSHPDAMDDNESKNDEALYRESSDDEESDIWGPLTSPTSDLRQIQDHPEEEWDFKPRTQEIEPSVSAAKHHIEQQGIECQRLGLSSFNKIRYVDAQKKLQASPVFGPLKTNYQLKNLMPKSSVPELLSKMDGSFGTTTHGPLLQRDNFSQGIKELVTKFPQIRQEAGKLWGPDSQFTQNSNDLLQFVCGKRAETIELRRKMFRPRNDMVASLLNNIPPSKSHLFEETELSELFKQHQSSFRPSFRFSKFDNQSKHPQSTFRKTPTHQTGSRPRNFPKTSKDFNKNAPTTSRAKETSHTLDSLTTTTTIKDNDYTEFRGGRLQNFVAKWAEMGAPSYVLKTIKDYSIPFVFKPPLIHLSMTKLRRPALSSMNSKIDDLIKQDVLERSAERTAFVSTMFPVIKPDEGEFYVVFAFVLYLHIIEKEYVSCNNNNLSNIDNTEQSDNDNSNNESSNFDWLKNFHDANLSREHLSDNNNNKRLFRDKLSNWAIKNRIKHVHLNKLLTLLIEEGYSDLPKDARTLLASPTKLKVEKLGSAKFVHFGLREGLYQAFKNKESLEKEIKLNFNIEGLPISFSSNKCLWSILCNIVMNAQTPFIVSLYEGVGKPDSFNDVLSTEKMYKVIEFVPSGEIDVVPVSWVSNDKELEDSRNNTDINITIINDAPVEESFNKFQYTSGSASTDASTSSQAGSKAFVMKMECLPKAALSTLQNYAELSDVPTTSKHLLTLVSDVPDVTYRNMPRTEASAGSSGVSTSILPKAAPSTSRTFVEPSDVPTTSKQLLPLVPDITDGTFMNMILEMKQKLTYYLGLKRLSHYNVHAAVAAPGVVTLVDGVRGPIHLFNVDVDAPIK